MPRKPAAPGAEPSRSSRVKDQPKPEAAAKEGSVKPRDNWKEGKAADANPPSECAEEADQERLAPEKSRSAKGKKRDVDEKKAGDTASDVVKDKGGEPPQSKRVRLRQHACIMHAFRRSYSVRSMYTTSARPLI